MRSHVRNPLGQSPTVLQKSQTVFGQSRTVSLNLNSCGHLVNLGRAIFSLQADELNFLGNKLYMCPYDVRIYIQFVSITDSVYSRSVTLFPFSICIV